jgi:hypothetical protein
MTNEEEKTDLTRSFIQQEGWRKRHMYRGRMLEPVIDTYGPRIAITRSNYGYRVLNTPDLGMIDVDFNLGFDAKPQELEVLSNLHSWVAEHPGQSWKAYRTAGGMRLIRIDAPQSLDDSFRRVCATIYGVDPLYVELCVKQAAFRMRISPKPYRIGLA